MKLLTGIDAKRAERFIQEAAKEARKSDCKKSQRGVVIERGGMTIGRGCNKSTCLPLCEPCIRKDIKDNGRVELCAGIHAEQMAIIDSVNSGNAVKLSGSTMYHIKTKNGEMVPSGPPSCTVCSRMIQVAGLNIVIWHKEGYVLYSPQEFNELSFQYFLGKK